MKPSSRLPLWSLPVAAVIVAAVAAPLLWKPAAPAAEATTVSTPVVAAKVDSKPLPKMIAQLPPASGGSDSAGESKAKPAE